MSDSNCESPKSVVSAVGQALFPYSRAEKAIKEALIKQYPERCEIDLRRSLSDFVESRPVAESQTKVVVDCPIAAVVYVARSSLIVGLVVFYEEVSQEQLDSARVYCSSRGIRLFPIEKLETYTAGVLDRALACEEAHVGPENISRLIPEARCPNCQGPLIHRIMKPTSWRNGLFYTCAQYYAGHFGAVVCEEGFLCGADEIFEYMDPDYRDLKFRLRNGVRVIEDSAATAG